MLLGLTTRDHLLEAAFDEPTGPYVATDGRHELRLRPFSLAVFRRAMRLEVAAVRRGFNAIAGDRAQVLADCERLAWLMSWDQPAVRQALSRGTEAVIAEAVADYTAHLVPGQLALVRREVERNLRLVRAAMFGVVARPPLSEAMEKARDDERAAEPGDLLVPPRLAAIALAVIRETGWPEDYVHEDLPLARFLQYAHGVQWSNAQVWTVEPDGPSMTGSDELMERLDAVREERVPVAIEF